MAQDKKAGNKAVQKGNLLFKQGEPAKTVYIVQAGLLSISNTRAGAKVEIYQATAPQTVGLEPLHGVKSYGNSAIALNDTTVAEISTDAVNQTLGRCPPSLKLIFNSLVNKSASIHSELSAIKLEGDPTPCPPALIAKLFATVFHVVSYSGAAKADYLRIVWPSFRKYCQRVFMESPVRLEQLIYLLSTIGLAELEMVKSDTDPDGPEELGFVRFKDIAQIEAFSEFFRKRFKQLGSDHSMELNDPCLQAGEVLLRAFNTAASGQASEVNVPVNEAVKVLQGELSNPALTDSDIEGWIGRGLPAELVRNGSGKNLKFTASQVKRMFQNFRILSKLTEWNKNGRAPGAPASDPKKDKQSK